MIPRAHVKAVDGIETSAAGHTFTAAHNPTVDHRMDFKIIKMSICKSFPR